MACHITVGASAPGLGKVLDVKQPYPFYSEDHLYSGNHGRVCLIFQGERVGDPAPFCIALWVHGEDEPRKPDYSMGTFEGAAITWEFIRNKMEGIP